jgi:hypothetical protein
VNSLANTMLTDRELLIHAVQHIEDLYEQLAEVHGAVMRMDYQLQVFAPFLAKLAPGGKVDMIAVMQARREARRDHAAG